MHCPYQLN